MANAQPPILIGNLTDPGKVRERNEDSLRYLQVGPRRLFVVADGMGGEIGGALASQLAVEAVQQTFESADSDLPVPEVLRQAVAAASAACRARQLMEPEYASMGTTLEVLVIEGSRGWWAHVGDSRIYLARGGQAQQLTEDHTVIQRLLREGLIEPSQAAEHPQRHVLSKAIGREDSVVPDIGEALDLREGDALVLCSDGLSDLVEPDEIAWVVERLGPHRACKRLVGLALERGGHDNVTVQVAYYGEARRSWVKRVTAIEPPTMRRRRSRRVALWASLGVVALLVSAAAAFRWWPSPEEKVEGSESTSAGALSDPPSAPDSAATDVEEAAPAPFFAGDQPEEPDPKVNNG